MTQQIRTFVSPAEDPGSQFPKFSSGQLTGYTPSPRKAEPPYGFTNTGGTHTYTRVIRLSNRNNISNTALFYY